MKATPENYLEVLEEVCTNTIAAEAVAVDRDGVFPEKSIGALKDAGLLAVNSSPGAGGLGLGLRGAAAVVERVARECGSTAMVTCMHYAGVAVLGALASEGVQRAAASGDHLSTLAFSEAGSRSHFWAPLSTATHNGEGILLNAKKSWITSADRAAAYIWSSRPLEAEGMSTLWLVPAGADGLTVHGPFDGLGLRGNDSSPVTAENVRVAASAMLGADGDGFNMMLQHVLPTFCVCNAACSVGFMQAAVSRTVAHISGTQFEHLDSPLADLPTIRNYIARMKVMTDASHMLLLDTLDALEKGREDAMLRVLESKASGGETAAKVLDLGMRICGGAAFRKDIGIERYFRDARAAGVMGPTTDVLYDFIGKAVCGMELFA